MNIYLRTGTVGTSLEHNRQGKTQLFRREVDTKAKLGNIFANPRVHTGTGYKEGKQMCMLTCCHETSYEKDDDSDNDSDDYYHYGSDSDDY